MAVLQVIGGGRMGEALVGGLLRAGTIAAGDVQVVEPVDARRKELVDLLAGVEQPIEPGAADGTVIDVKPGDVPTACRAAAAAGSGGVLAIAAGVTIGSLEAERAPGTAVVRAMPNTPALVGLGATVIAPGSAAGDDGLAWAESLLGAVGTGVRVKEHLLDAVTG